MTAKLKKSEIDTLYKRVFNTEDGKVVLKDLLRQCRYGKFKSGTSEDILRQIGQEDTAIYILNRLYKKEIQEDLDNLQETYNIF